MRINMAKYAISVEGAESLNLLANKLLESKNSIVEASSRLSTVIDSLDDRLGVYADIIRDIIRKNRTDLNTHQESIDDLVSRLRGKAEEIYGLFGIDERTIGRSNNPVISAVQGQSTMEQQMASSVPVSENARPRDLGLGNTQYGFKQDGEGNLFYDSPIETNQYMYTTQGAAYPQFQGTCGLCSCANVIRLAGVNASEKDMVDYASTALTGNIITPHLCDTGFSDPGMNGGTSPHDRQAILSHFGIDSGIIPLDSNPMKQIGQFVSEGRGVIISVHADTLWYNDNPDPGNGDLHAVTVTSVKMDRLGNILGLYICDSAQGGTTYYSSEKIKRALSSAPMNVTYQVIR